MHPILIDFGTWDLPFAGTTHLFLPTYGLLFACAALVAWAWFRRRAGELGVSEEHRFNLGFYSLLAGILGAKLTLVLVDWRYYTADPLRLFGTLRAAGVVMGGIAAGAIVFILYCRRHGLPLYRLGDAIAAPLALGQAVGRLGCTSAGCCWGVPTGHPWFHIVFTDRLAHEQTGVPLDEPLVPTQLLHFASEALLAVVLTVLWRRRPVPAGTVFWIYMVLYGVTRAVIEVWRGDAARGRYFHDTVSTSQILAAVSIAIGLWMLVRGRRARAATA